MTLSAFSADGALIYSKNFYSIGGGFIRTDDDFDSPRELYAAPPYPYEKASELLTSAPEKTKPSRRSLWPTKYSGGLKARSASA